MRQAISTGPGIPKTTTGSAVKVDGLAPTQSRVVAAATYNATTIYAVQVILKGTGTLTLSPYSGDTDIVITAAELTELAGTSRVFYGPYNSVTAGAGMELLAYTA